MARNSTNQAKMGIRKSPGIKDKIFSGTPKMPEVKPSPDYLPVNVLYLTPEQFKRVTQIAGLDPGLAEPEFINTPSVRPYSAEIDEGRNANAEAGMLQTIIIKLRMINIEVDYAQACLMQIRGEGIADDSNKEKALMCPAAEIEDLLIRIYATATDVRKRTEKL